MHELSIAMSIVELAEEESERRGGLHITAVHLRLGLLAGVVKGALLSSFEMACEHTSLAGSQLVVEEIPGVVYCPACDARRPVRSSEWFYCSECGSIASEIVQGKELEVVSLEVQQ
jgi:hydrogenase nickel incorporation protein HypA/HybF